MSKSISWGAGRRVSPSDRADSRRLICPRAAVATALLLAMTSPAFAQNSNLSDHERQMHNESERNTQYFNNADSYPKPAPGNFARFFPPEPVQSHNRDDSGGQQPRRPQNSEEYFADLKQQSAAGDVDAKIKLADLYYYGRGVAANKAETFRLYREAGSVRPHAEFIAGHMLFAGDGLTANVSEGQAMIKHAAAAGDPAAIAWSPLIQRTLELAARGDLAATADAGTMLIHGIGVVPDRARGLAMIQDAAARGDLGSIQNLAYWYRTPDAGVLPYDIVKSHAWLLKAAQAGDVDAMATAGTDLIVNEGVPVDVKECLRWSQLAADKGNIGAVENLGVLYNGGYSGVPADRVQAATYYRQAITGRSKTATERLIRLYEGSDGGAPDYAKALEIRRPLAEKGDAASETYLGVYYEKGYGVTKDVGKAMAWFAKGAKDGSARGAHELAKHYLDGDGVPEDEPKAVQLFRQAAGQGFAPSLDSMGMFTFKGAFGVQQDELEGIRLFHLAAEKGDSDAAYNLALIYDEGIGVDEDKAEGLKWFKAGAERGNKKCIQKLKKAGYILQTGVVLAPVPGNHVMVAGVQEEHSLETVGSADEKTNAAGAEDFPAIFIPAPWTTLFDTAKCTADQLAQARERIVHTPLRKHNHIDYAYNMLAALYAKAKGANATLTQSVWILAIHDKAVAGDAAAGYLWGAARGARFGVKLGPDGEVEGYLRPLMTKGRPEAMRDYAVLYQSGKGVKQSPEKAFALVTKAADAGLPSARSLLGQFLSQGLGTPKDPNAAAAAWKQAADAGDAVAQYYYGVGAATGDGMPKNEAVGIAYLKKAAEAGDDRAMLNYGIALQLGLCGLTVDERTGTEYIDRAALAGNAAAQDIMGDRYANGRGVSQDDTWACLYWEVAAKNGNSDAQFSFAKRKLSGIGTTKNEAEAEEWLNEAAAQDNAEAVEFMDARARDATESPTQESKI